MFVISDIAGKLLEKLRKKAYRHAYLAEHVRRGVAYQIRALRDQRKWKQGEFAAHLGKPQSVAHRLEDPDYGKYTLQTLLEVANVFDVALEVRFVSYSTFIGNTRDVSIASMQAPSFSNDLGMMGLFPVPIQGAQAILVSAGSIETAAPVIGAFTLAADPVVAATLH